MFFHCNFLFLLLSIPIYLITHNAITNNVFHIMVCHEAIAEKLVRKILALKIEFVTDENGIVFV